MPAKRYLCAVEGHYDQLARDSRRSLELQGGNMTADEVAAFRREAYGDAAIRVRRYDDTAKTPTAATPPFEYFLEKYVEPLVSAGARAGS